MVGLVAGDKTYPIIKDDGGRRFFKDERLLNKEYRITGRLVGGSLLQVISVQSVKNGKPSDIYYWCDICAIRRSEKNDCECCGGPMDLAKSRLRSNNCPALLCDLCSRDAIVLCSRDAKSSERSAVAPCDAPRSAPETLRVAATQYLMTFTAHPPA